MKDFKDSILQSFQSTTPGVLQGAVVNPVKNIAGGIGAAYDFANSVLGHGNQQQSYASGVPTPITPSQQQPTPTPNASGVTELGEPRVVTPTPFPGQEKFVHDKMQQFGGNADDWKNVYIKGVTDPGFNGTYYDGTKAKPTQQVLGAETINPTMLPTYNNPEEINKAAPYKDMIAQSAKNAGIPPEILAAALWRESAGFNPKFINGIHIDGTGRGIAGIDAVQRKDIPDSVAYDPKQAIDFMAKTLKAYENQDENIYNALRHYNGGPNYTSQNIGFDGKSTIDQLTKRHADYIKANAENLKALFQ